MNKHFGVPHSALGYNTQHDTTVAHYTHRKNHRLLLRTELAYCWRDNQHPNNRSNNSKFAMYMYVGVKVSIGKRGKWKYRGTISPWCALVPALMSQLPPVALWVIEPQHDRTGGVNGMHWQSVCAKTTYVLCFFDESVGFLPVFDQLTVRNVVQPAHVTHTHTHTLQSNTEYLSWKNDNERRRGETKHKTPNHTQWRTPVFPMWFPSFSSSSLIHSTHTHTIQTWCWGTWRPRDKSCQSLSSRSGCIQPWRTYYNNSRLRTHCITNTCNILM